MSECSHNCASCGKCENCGACLVLNEVQLQILEKLAQIPFLPVARKTDTPDPIYLEDAQDDPEKYTAVLLSLEQMGLITLDYDIPIKGYRGARYGAYPIVGSFALTARGQHVLELLELQGLSEA